jgi:hypothetical protein
LCARELNSQPGCGHFSVTWQAVRSRFSGFVDKTKQVDDVSNNDSAGPSCDRRGNAGSSSTGRVAGVVGVAGAMTGAEDRQIAEAAVKGLQR